MSSFMQLGEPASLAQQAATARPNHLSCYQGKSLVLNIGNSCFHSGEISASTEGDSVRLGLAGCTEADDGAGPAVETAAGRSGRW